VATRNEGLVHDKTSLQHWREIWLAGLICYENREPADFPALEAHMRVSFLPSIRIAVLFAAFVAVTILFLTPAHARPGDQQALDEAGAGGGRIVVNIDKTTQKMTVSLDGVQTYSWPVSTGMRGYSTPSGSFTATSMNEIWYSKEWDNAPMPHAVFFIRDGHAIHATYDVKHLGRPASHGCVRLSPQNAATLFTLVKKSGLKNTQVVVSGNDSGGDYLSSRREPDQPASRPVRQAAQPEIQPARQAAQPPRRPARQLARQPAPASQETFSPRIFGFQ
jgi:hypothetical protein